MKIARYPAATSHDDPVYLGAGELGSMITRIYAQSEFAGYCAGVCFTASAGAAGQRFVAIIGPGPLDPHVYEHCNVAVLYHRHYLIRQHDSPVSLGKDLAMTVTSMMLTPKLLDPSGLLTALPSIVVLRPGRFTDHVITLRPQQRAPAMTLADVCLAILGLFRCRLRTASRHRRYGQTMEAVEP